MKHLIPIACLALACAAPPPDSRTAALDDLDAAAELPANLPPVAIQYGPTSGFTDEPIQFHGTSSYDPDGSIRALVWDWGDGSNWSVAPVVEHAFHRAGAWDVLFFLLRGPMRVV